MFPTFKYPYPLVYRRNDTRRNGYYQEQQELSWKDIRLCMSLYISYFKYPYLLVHRAHDTREARVFPVTAHVPTVCSIH